MATYTTLFVATDSELSQVFPGWRFPRKRPKVMRVKNPFSNTGEVMVVTTWDRLFSWRKLLGLSEVLCGKGVPAARFVDCRDSEGFIQALPTAALQAASKLNENGIKETAVKWLAEVNGTDDLDEFTEYLWYVRALANVAIERSGNLFCHMA